MRWTRRCRSWGHGLADLHKAGVLPDWELTGDTALQPGAGGVEGNSGQQADVEQLPILIGHVERVLTRGHVRDSMLHPQGPDILDYELDDDGIVIVA